MNSSAKQKTWKVGEIAQMTGLSIRALHHYDEIGLLKPSLRSDAGHRVFVSEDLVKLQQILSLRHLGLSLEEIKRTLDDAGFSFLDTVVRLKSQIQKQRVHLEQIESKLTSLERQLTNDEQFSIERIIQFLEAMTMFEKYLTKDQQDTVSAYSLKMGPDRLEQVKSTEWPELIAEVQKELNQGTDPSEPRLHPLAVQWMKLVSEFTGGDPKIAQGIRKMYESEPNAASMAGFPNVDMVKLMNYISTILNTQKKP